MTRAPIVDPMMVRRFTPIGHVFNFSGVIIALDDFDVEDIGLATERLDFDEDVVDCSRRIFQITNEMIMANRDLVLSVFPSRRWRNMREGDQITAYPDRDNPLLYIGNPVPLSADSSGIHVGRLPEFLIKTGMELGF